MQLTAPLTHLVSAKLTFGLPLRELRLTDIRTTDIRTSKTLGVRTLLHSGFVSQEAVQAAVAAPAFSYLDDLQIRCGAVMIGSPLTNVSPL